MAEKTVPAVTQKPTESVREALREGAQHLRPPVDIYETKEGLVVVADLPGVEEENLRIHVDKEVLTIAGETRPIAPRDPIWSEFRLLNFYREFTLPEIVDAANINAELKHGVLTINLPKMEQAKPRQTEVNVK